MDPKKREQLIKGFREVINTHSAENESGTPDFILAEMLVDFLDTFNQTTIARECWHGRQPTPADSEPAGPSPSRHFNVENCDVVYPPVAQDALGGKDFGSLLETANIDFIGVAIDVLPTGGLVVIRPKDKPKNWPDWDVPQGDRIGDDVDDSKVCCAAMREAVSDVIVVRGEDDIALFWALDGKRDGRPITFCPWCGHPLASTPDREVKVIKTRDDLTKAFGEPDDSTELADGTREAFRQMPPSEPEDDDEMVIMPSQGPRCVSPILTRKDGFYAVDGSQQYDPSMSWFPSDFLGKVGLSLSALPPSLTVLMASTKPIPESAFVEFRKTWPEGVDPTDPDNADEYEHYDIYVNNVYVGNSAPDSNPPFEGLRFWLHNVAPATENDKLWLRILS